MAGFQLGPVIRSRREELGLSQEDLADGICSVPTLSRIENGERMPTKNHLEMLMQRLGYSTITCDYYTDKRDFQIHELKFRIRQANVAKKKQLATELLSRLESVLTDPSDVDRQFVILHRVLLDQGTMTNAQRLKHLEEALLLTCPRYRSNRIPKVLSYEEIILLNNIAICLSREGQMERAISMLYEAKSYYERHVVIPEEALRTQPMVLYNLSKLLGQNGQYDDCIAVCEQGIHLAQLTGRSPLLGQTFFNRAWALLHRNRDGDREDARYTLKQAYYCASILQQTKDSQSIGEFYRKEFGETLSI